MQFISATPVSVPSNSQPPSYFPQCVIAVSDRDLCVIPWREENDVGGANEDDDRPHVAHRRLLKTSGRVTALAAHYSSAHRALILMTGTVSGRVDVWRLPTLPESETMEIELVSELHAPIKNLPVNHLHFHLPSNIREKGSLILAQSELEQESWRDLTKPSVAALTLSEHLDIHTIDFETDLFDGNLGEVLAMKEFKEGNTCRVALVSNRYDTNGQPSTVVSTITKHAGAPTVSHNPLSTAVFATADIEFYNGGSSCDILCPERIFSCAGMHKEKLKANGIRSRYGGLADRIGARSSHGLHRSERSDFAKHMRVRLEGELFIDRLLRDVCVREPSLRYPAQSAKDLQDLINEVAAAHAAERDKDRVCLYLAHDGKAGEDARFVREYLISSSDMHEVAGYWALDHGKFEEGVRLLSLAKKIESTMASKVLKALITNDRHMDAARYFQATRPDLRTEEDKCLRMALHLRHDLHEALMFQRRHRRSPLGDRLWQQLLHFVFQEKPESPAIAKAFLLLPFTAEEEARLAAYCQSLGSCPALRFIVAYFIQRGRLSDALQYFRKLQQLEIRGRNSKATSVDAALNAAKLTNFEAILPFVYRIGEEEPILQSTRTAQMPLSANANIRTSALNNVEAQSALLTAARRAAHTGGEVAPPPEYAEATSLEDTFEIISHDHTSLDVTAIFSDHDAPSELDEGELISPPESAFTDSGPPSPTPSARSSVENNASPHHFASPERDMSRRFPEHAAATTDLISSSPSSVLQLYPHPTSPPVDARPRPPSIYPPVPAALLPTVPAMVDPFRRSFASPEMAMNVLKDREEQVERVKSPVGPSVPQAPPMKSMSPFERVQEPPTPPTDRPKRRAVRQRSPSPPGRKSVSRPASFQSRLASVAREQAAAVPPTPARRSGRIAAKQQTHDSDDDEPFPQPTTRKRVKLAIDEPTILADDHVEDEEVEDPGRASAPKTPGRASSAATAAAAPRSTRRRTTLSAALNPAPPELENTQPHTAPPATPKPRASAKAKPKTPAPSALRERNATPTRTTRTTAKKMPAPPTPAKDEPMSLADLDASPAPRRPAARAAKAAENHSKPTTAKKTPASAVLSRTVLTRRMAKKLEEEGQL
ncbi:Protein ELYS [Geranomyces variabilis]|nr:Protein ELYS [Geranomyces variabilis]